MFDHKKFNDLYVDFGAKLPTPSTKTPDIDTTDIFKSFVPITILD